LDFSFQLFSFSAFDWVISAFQLFSISAFAPVSFSVSAFDFVIGLSRRIQAKADQHLPMCVSLFQRLRVSPQSSTIIHQPA
jgi:hypothetical protein